MFRTSARDSDALKWSVVVIGADLPQSVPARSRSPLANSGSHIGDKNVHIRLRTYYIIHVFVVDFHMPHCYGQLFQYTLT